MGSSKTVTIAWRYHEDMERHYGLATGSRVDTERANPFDFVLGPESIKIAANYESDLEFALSSYLAPTSSSAEVYLPGAGWTGYNLMYNLAMSDQHVSLAAACNPSLAAPIIGTFRGNDATSTIRTEMKVSETV